MTVEELIKTASDCVEGFRAEIGGSSVDFSEDKKRAVWSVSSGALRIEFILTKKESIIVPAATLFSRVYFQEDSNRHFHIPEFIHLIDEKDLHCYYFPYTESGEKIERYIGILADFYVRHKAALTAIAEDGTKYRKLLENKENEMFSVMSFKESEIPEDETERTLLIDSLMKSYENNVLLLRYTKYEGYVAFLAGKYDKAQKTYSKLAKKDALLQYEKRIISYMETADEPYEALAVNADSFTLGNSYISGKENSLFMIKAMPLCFAVSFLILGGVVLGTRLYFSQGTVYYNDAYAIIMALIFAALCGMFGAMTFRRPLMKLLSAKKSKELLAYDDIANTKKNNKFLNLFFEFVFLACLALTVWFSSMNVACYEDRMVYNPGEGFFSFETETKYFADITDVYHVDGLYNDYGDWIDRSFYVICFKDGTTFNTDGFFSEKEAGDNFIPVISDYFDEIKSVKTEEDIVLQ